MGICRVEFVHQGLPEILATFGTQAAGQRQETMAHEELNQLSLIHFTHHVHHQVALAVRATIVKAGLGGSHRLKYQNIQHMDVS